MAYTVTIGRRNEDEEERKRRLQEANRTFIANNIKSSIAKSGAVDISSGTPAVKTSVGQTTLPKASDVTVGPKTWDKTATVTTLPKAKPTVNNSSRLVSALERASKASDLTPTARQMTRSNNFLKGVGTSLAATVPTLVDTTKQSLSDWQDKVKHEGMASALSEMARNMDNPNWTYGNPVSTDSTGYRLYQRANDYFQKAQSGLNPAQREEMGIAASIAQNAVTLPTAAINPAAPLVIMGAGAAANRANELTSEGKTATEALGRGLLSGALEVATEKIPLENLLSIAKTGGKSAVRNVLQQMGTEGAEELASYIMNYAADISAGDTNADFSPSEAASSFLGGAISGGVMGGAASAIGNAPSYRQIQADNISYNNVLPRGNSSYSSDTSGVNVNVGNMNAGEYFDMLPRTREYASNAVNELTNAETPLALPRPTDFYSTPEGLTTERVTESWSTKPKTRTVIDNPETRSYQSLYAKNDISAYNFIRETAENRGVSEQKVYDAYKKARDNLYNNEVEQWVNTINNYEPQGVQTNIIEADTRSGYKRLTQSNNESWYSELYKRYGHKPYKSQQREAAEYLVNKGLNESSFGRTSEYIDPEVARQINGVDAMLSGYDAVTDNGRRRDVIDIRNIDDDIYEISYGTPRGEFINDPTTFYQGRMAAGTMPRAVDQQNGLTGDNVLSRPVRMGNASTNIADTYSDENTISKKERANDLSSVISKLKNNIKNLEKMEPVSSVTGTEFQKGKEKITETVGRFFASLGNKVKRSGFGDITIDVDGIKDSIAHGIGKRKAATFKAVPDILSKGKQIDHQTNWKGRNYDTYIFAAPIKFGNETNYVAAVVRSSGNKNRYYLHEVVDQNGNIIYSNNKSNGNNTDSSAIGFKTTSIGANNNPLLNNIIPQNAENINIPQQKELGEREVMPTAESERSADSFGIVNPEVQQLFEDSKNAVGRLRRGARKLYQSAISVTAPFERMAKADTRENARNISALVNKYSQKGGITDTILTKGMFDINGNKIDNRSFVEVASQVPNGYKQLFNEYWDELHNIDRQAQGKPVTKHTADESRQRAAEIESQHPEFKKYKDDISDYLDKFMRAWGVDSGLISEEAYLAMKNMYPNYVPTYRVDGGGAGSGYVRSGKKLRGNTGIGKAKGSTAEVMSFDEAIAKKINTMIAAATKNDISREIFSFAQALPAEAARSGIMIDTDTSGQYGGQMDLDEYIDSVDKNIARQISKGNYEITFYNNGKPQTMKISRDVWEAFNFLDSRLGGVEAFETFAKIGRTLTSPMRGLTTTYNPLFFMTNLIRDMQTYVINNTASNSAAALKNYVRAIKGIATQAETFEQYKALGGSQNGYYGSNIYSQAYERVNPSARSAGQKIADRIKILPRAIEAVGEFTEKIPRYAEFLNTIDRLGNTDAGRLQASLNAADVTVNFNRSSPLSTMANAWVPYFNAGLQGMDKTLRQIKAHPVKTGTRAAVSVFLPTLLLYLVNKDNPHWEDVKDGVRDSYYLIPNTFGPHDANGYAETFIRLPKSREFGALFSASFERFIRAFEESEDEGKSLSETLPTAFEGYGDTLLNSFLPPDILGDNIIGSFRRLGTNTAWHGGKIVPSNLENVSPEFQYDINTSGLAMEIAERAQKIPGAPDWLKSPMKVDYLIDSYGGYGADLVQGLTSRKNQGATTGETLANSVYTGVIQPFINRFTTDSAYSNYNLDRFYDELDVLETAANDRNLRENLPSDYRTPEEKVESDFTEARNDISDITKQERAVLESAMPISEKNAQIRALKQQKNAIAKEMLQNENALYSQYEDSYIPVISGLRPERQEAARELNRDYGLTYDEFADIYEKYSEINDEDIKPRMKATKFEEYLNSLGFTDKYAITPVLKDEFSYFNMSPATSYYDSESYQKVNGILPVETYADLSGLVNGLESGIDYPKGERSPFVKSLIDEYLERYGYDPTYDERLDIYRALGVSKSYVY